MEFPLLKKPSVGQENNLKELWRYVEDEDVGVIGICGPGGIGKTDLCRSFINSIPLSSTSFDKVIYLTVSRDFKLRKLQKDILHRLDLKPREEEDPEIQAATIYVALSRTRYLLVLDDLWEWVDLKNIGIPLPNSKNRCKVVITTRSHRVCGIMKAREITVTPLSFNESQYLFYSIVGEGIVSTHPKIALIAEEIVKQCHGLPLALVSIAHALKNKMSVKEWTDTLLGLKKPNKTTYSPLNVVLSILKVSYDQLPTQLMKDCFLYCSLFPKDYLIRIKQLIGYWTGEGFFDHMEWELESLCNEARRVILSLNEAGMLEGGKSPQSEVILTGMMHDLALEITEGKFLVGAGRQVKEELSYKERWEEIERISLIDSSIRSLDVVPQCPRLLTLILRQSTFLKTIPDNILQSHTLRVLDLSRTGIKEIPRSIGSLSELGFLDLSFTKIRSLPKEVRGLVKLKHLGLEGTKSLTEIPRDVLSKLSNVLVLNMYDSYGDWECQDGNNMASIEDLECLPKLGDTGITICKAPTLERFLSSPLRRSTWRLILKECEDLLTFHLSSSLENTRELTVSDCQTLQKFIIDSTDEEEMKAKHLNLEVLQLLGLTEVQILFRRGVVGSNFLQRLREITIDSCPKLTEISWVSQLESLEHLNLYCCKKIESVLEDDTNEGQPEKSEAFQKLKTMTLRNLRSLKRICTGSLEFPCLEYLTVLECPQLGALPLRTKRSEGSMRVIYGEVGWWRDLEWADKNVPYELHFQAE